VAGARDDSWTRLCFICLCLAAKPSHVQADVDGQASFLHHPTFCCWQVWVQCSLTGAALSHCVVVVGDAFPWGARPPGLDIYYGVDRLGA
jgi:hypothetical protein